jgi:Zn-dependent protease
MPNGTGLKIARIVGIPIYLDTSWVFVFALITWMFKAQFTLLHPAWTPAQYWGVGIVTSLLFFSSVVFHELAHGVVAMHYKLRVVSITLFFFGGLARIGRDPAKALQEFNIAIAGPLASAFLAAAFFGITKILPDHELLTALSNTLSIGNGMLAGFNLLPGFPLDGGRIFRAIVWGATGNYSRATRVAGGSGKLLAAAMVGFGAWFALKGDWPYGLWLIFIGWYLLNAANESVAQVAVRESLVGLCAADVMSQEVPIVGGHITLEDYSAEVLRTGRRCHMVVSDDNLAGMMNVQALNSAPREEWAHSSVQAVMIPREHILWVSPEEPLQRLLERLLAADVNQMPVVTKTPEGAAHIIGMVTRDSILRVIQTRTELGRLAQSRSSAP